MNKSTLSALVVALMLGSGIAGYLIGKPGDTIDRPPPARTATTTTSQPPTPSRPAPAVTPTPAALPAPAPSIDISRIDGQVSNNSIKKVGEVVSAHPEEALAIIRTWLHQPV